jgi:hypothetical protein
MKRGEAGWESRGGNKIDFFFLSSLSCHGSCVVLIILRVDEPFHCAFLFSFLFFRLDYTLLDSISTLFLIYRLLFTLTLLFNQGRDKEGEGVVRQG